MTIFTGQLGGRDSSLGHVAPGYDVGDEIFVIWLKNKHAIDNPQYQIFGADEGGYPIILQLGVPGVITRAQAAQAQRNGAILISITPLPNPN